MNVSVRLIHLFFFFFTNLVTLWNGYISVLAWTVLFLEVSFLKKCFKIAVVFLASSTFLPAAAPFVSEEQRIL